MCVRLLGDAIGALVQLCCGYRESGMLECSGSARAANADVLRYEDDTSKQIIIFTFKGSMSGLEDETDVKYIFI